MINWIKRIFSGGNTGELAKTAVEKSLEDIATSISALGEKVDNNDRAVNKGLRRLSLAQKQQNDAIESLQNESKSLKHAISDRHGIVLNYKQILDILDDFSKISPSMTNKDIIVPLVTRATQHLLYQVELLPVAQTGTQYPAEGCEVVGAIDNPSLPAGTVHEILQQGYRTPEGILLRKAKVIVNRQTSNNGK